MDSGLLQRAMPGSLYPAFTHSDSQRRLQSQCRGLVPSALGGRAGSQGRAGSLSGPSTQLDPPAPYPWPSAKAEFLDVGLIGGVWLEDQLTPDCTSNPWGCLKPHPSSSHP